MMSFSNQFLAGVRPARAISPHTHQDSREKLPHLAHQLLARQLNFNQVDTEEEHAARDKQQGERGINFRGVALVGQDDVEGAVLSEEGVPVQVPQPLSILKRQKYTENTLSYFVRMIKINKRNQPCQCLHSCTQLS